MTLQAVLIKGLGKRRIAGQYASKVSREYAEALGERHNKKNGSLGVQSGGMSCATGGDTRGADLLAITRERVGGYSPTGRIVLVGWRVAPRTGNWKWGCGSHLLNWGDLVLPSSTLTPACYFDVAPQA